MQVGKNPKSFGEFGRGLSHGGRFPRDFWWGGENRSDLGVVIGGGTWR